MIYDAYYSHDRYDNKDLKFHASFGMTQPCDFNAPFNERYVGQCRFDSVDVAHGKGTTFSEDHIVEGYFVNGLMVRDGRIYSATAEGYWEG